MNYDEAVKQALATEINKDESIIIMTAELRESIGETDEDKIHRFHNYSGEGNATQTIDGIELPTAIEAGVSGVTRIFKYLPFNVRRTSDLNDDPNHEPTIELVDPNNDMLPFINMVQDQAIKLELVYRMYLLGDLSAPFREAKYLVLNLAEAQHVINITLTSSYNLNKTFPSKTYTQREYPSLS